MPRWLRGGDGGVRERLEKRLPAVGEAVGRQFLAVHSGWRDVGGGRRRLRTHGIGAWQLEGPQGVPGAALPWGLPRAVCPGGGTTVCVNGEGGGGGGGRGGFGPVGKGVLRGGEGVDPPPCQPTGARPRPCPPFRGLFVWVQIWPPLCRGAAGPLAVLSARGPASCPCPAVATGPVPFLFLPVFEV